MKQSANAVTRTSTTTRRKAVARAAAPPLAPEQPPVDLAHLAQMTLGERKLEREVLTLFSHQATMLMGRIVNEPPKVAAALAHTLSGSARGVGAWKVAEAAQAVERMAGQVAPMPMTDAVDRLVAVVAEAKTVIADLLRQH